MVVLCCMLLKSMFLPCFLERSVLQESWWLLRIHIVVIHCSRYGKIEVHACLNCLVFCMAVFLHIVYLVMTTLCCRCGHSILPLCYFFLYFSFRLWSPRCDVTLMSSKYTMYAWLWAEVFFLCTCTFIRLFCWINCIVSCIHYLNHSRHVYF